MQDEGGSEPLQVNDIDIDLVEKAENEWAEVERLQNGIHTYFNNGNTLSIN